MKWSKKAIIIVLSALILGTGAWGVSHLKPSQPQYTDTLNTDEPRGS
ncbi:hypothetical protein C8P63_14412 [Melghirimyces profundicolus]|uniref:Uncharacterized protein n=1 Tax=Melghirimyces profundicolus TaxID=1242148 RepID=A0A2T6AY39_9BACL|nr:hypothetical protein C8P63_14412 [Melghirimyces profundicolus]